MRFRGREEGGVLLFRGSLQAQRRVGWRVDVGTHDEAFYENERVELACSH